jgi:hypothetical protein
MQDDETLEQSGTKKPDLAKIIEEVQSAQTDVTGYPGRMAQSRAWWNCEWPGQSVDGRLWSDNCGTPKESMFPWDGCSDSRLRIVQTIIQEYVTLSLAAFWSSKKQAKSIRQFAQGRQVSVAQRMLDWRVGIQMKRELLRELPMMLGWRFGNGLAFNKIEWEQMRELSYVPITVDMITQISQALGLGDVMDKLLDPDKTYDKELVGMMQSMSPVLPTAEARSVLNELRATGQSQLPVASLRVNKPKWSAKRPYFDVLFPSETVDIQQARFTCERELVSETELTDRIVTDGYDSNFVESVLEHPGVFANWWSHRPDMYLGSDRNMFELNHFLSWRLHQGTPCLYRTVFNESVAGDKLYAVHRKFEYDHGQFPFVAMRRGYMFRPLLSSIGIAEEAYTDELDMKRQQDGLNNHTDVVHNPPMILPTLRAQAHAQAYGPRAVMTAMRPESVVWQPLPPMDQTPVLVMQFVQQRLDRRYPITGGEVDPEIKALHRQQVTSDILGEFELALEQTYQLMQQFESDEDIQRVAGGDPWNYSRKDIQGQYEISATCDINLIDQERAQMKLQMLAQLLPFKEQGAVFQAAAQIVDPDLADMLSQDQASPVAMQKEKDAEYAAMGQIMSGIDPPAPMMAMNQLRLQTMNEVLSQPQVMQKYQSDPIVKKIVDNRVKFFMNQIQQYQANPQIGRTLATQAMQPNQPAALTQGATAQ